MISLSHSNFNAKKEKRGEKVESNTFFIKLLIDQLVHPWLKENQNAHDGIALGLKEIHTYYDHIDFQDNFSSLLQGLAIYTADGSYPKAKMKDYMLAFCTMFEVAEQIMMIERNVLSKAA